MKLTRRRFGLLLTAGLATGRPAPVWSGPPDPEEIIDIHAHLGSFAGYDLSLPTLLTGMQANHGVT